jgi:hypothetical protein
MPTLRVTRFIAACLFVVAALCAFGVIEAKTEGFVLLGVAAAVLV